MLDLFGQLDVCEGTVALATQIYRYADCDVCGATEPAADRRHWKYRYLRDNCLTNKLVWHRTSMERM